MNYPGLAVPLVRRLCLGTVFIGNVISASAAHSATFTVPGTANPWLAGMPDGTTTLFGDDIAPDQSPVEITGIPILPGAAYSFRASGSVSIDPSAALVGPEPSNRFAATGVFHRGGAENGIGDIWAPQSALIGVFLGSDRPDLSAAPAALWFYQPGHRLYHSLSPPLKSPFFIGDGLADDEPQRVIAPAGATRLFLGTMDGFGWHNNLGSFDVQVRIVPESQSLSLAAFGTVILSIIARQRRTSSSPLRD